MIGYQPARALAGGSDVRQYVAHRENCLASLAACKAG